MARWMLNSWPLLLLLVAASQQARLPPVEDVVQLETKGYQALSGSFETREDNNSEDNYRLPNNTVPIAYNVELWTQVHNGTRNFSGSVTIDLQVLEASNTITLHARQTENFEAILQSKDSATSAPISLNVNYENTREFLTFKPVDDTISFAKDSNWTLSINYTGLLRNDMGGFYISTYTDDSNVVQ